MQIAHVSDFTRIARFGWAQLINVWHGIYASNRQPVMNPASETPALPNFGYYLIQLLSLPLFHIESQLDGTIRLPALFGVRLEDAQESSERYESVVAGLLKAKGRGPVVSGD
jgi:hypothetical protein